MANNKTKFTVQQLTRIALMAALVFASNFLSFPIGDTRIHLGNIFILLAGFYLGGLHGGLAAGIGAMLFDLFYPGGIYITSAPTTFVFRFLMAYTAGAIAHTSKRAGRNAVCNTIAAIAASALYMVLYLSKTYISQALLGANMAAALGVVVSKARTSSVNALLGVLAAVPLSQLPLPFRK